MKLMITLGVVIGSLIGGWAGAALDHGNWLGGWSILFSALGAFVGIWAGYKAAQYISG